MENNLVLSSFPGVDGLGRGFEKAGCCVVRGPDVLWGGDARTFHPPAGVWWGCIAGPPCQLFTRLRHLVPNAGKRHGNLIPEFERITFEAQPDWFIMENVPDAPMPSVSGYIVQDLILNNRWLGEIQERTRRFSFGTRDGRSLVVDVALFESLEYRQAVTSSLRAVPVRLGGSGKVKRSLLPDGRRPGPDRDSRESLAEMCRLQGYPDDFLAEAPFTMAAKRLIVGNMVPDAMAYAIAKAVRRAMEGHPGEEAY